MIKAIAVLALMSGTSPAHTENLITVEAIKPDHFTLTLTSASVFDVESAQAVLAPAAQSLCPNKHPEFGHYRFEGSETVAQSSDPDVPTDFKIVQQIKCVEVVRNRSASDKRSYISDPDDLRFVQKKVLSLSEAYFYDLYDGNYEKASASFSREMRAFDASDKLSSQVDQIRSEAGTTPSINVHRITVYDSPPHAPEPGLYVAADYQNVFNEGSLHCGYLMWFRKESGQFEIIRQETGVLTDDFLSQTSEQNRADILSKIGCTAR